MEIPIRINGEVTGRLEIMPEGNYTLFQGRCADPGRLLRLSVYGGGREGYIGVMMPENGTVSIKKRYSRFDLRHFPEKLEYAAEAGQSQPEKKAHAPEDAAEIETATATPVPPLDSPAPEVKADGKCASPDKSAEAPTIEPEENAADAVPTPPEGETAAPGEAPPDAPESAVTAGAEPPGELIWYEGGDGALYTRWEGKVYVALPLTAPGTDTTKLLERRWIEGTEYGVYPGE